MRQCELVKLSYLPILWCFWDEIPSLIPRWAVVEELQHKNREFCTKKALTLEDDWWIDWLIGWLIETKIDWNENNTEDPNSTQNKKN